MPVEIVHDKKQGQESTKIITYVGGNAYSAPMAYIKEDGNAPIDDYFYLHRDYLGSILAISDGDRNVKERRQFGTWGSVDNYTDDQGNTDFTHESLVDRGFTGHEHFFSVGLIHMNGRMYDARLGRFLSPDNNIQAPYSTQSFNRFGYVWNNPLKYSDPSGESLILAIAIGAIIGAATAAVTYSLPAIASGNWNFASFGLSVLYGAVAGSVSGALSAAGSALTTSAIANGGSGAFWQSSTFNILSSSASQVGGDLAFGDNITLGTFAGSIAGGFVGGGLPKWTGIKGEYFKNAFGEISHNAFNGGLKGGVAGEVGAIIDGGDLKNDISQGAHNGAFGGASQSIGLIATFGATYKPTQKKLKYADQMAKAKGFSTDNVAWRKSGIYQVLQPLWTSGHSHRAVTWGLNVATFGNTSAGTFGHEFGHIIQVYNQGWAQFQGKGTYEQLFMNHPYSNPEANEYNANQLRLNLSDYPTFY